MARGTVRLTRALVAGLSWLLLGSVSCDNPLSPDAPRVERIDVNPVAVNLTVGATQSVVARVVGSDGGTATDRKTFWSTQNPQVATVSQVGLVTAISAGNTQVAVSAGGKSAVVPVTVTPRPVSQVRLEPTAASVQAGASVSLRADPVDATGTPVTGRPVQWATSAAAVATVTSTGVVSGVSPGTATITATVDGVAGSALVTVTPVPVATVTVSPSSGSLIVGQTLQLSATTASGSGATLTGRVVTWSSSANTVATVSSTGLVFAVAPGSATISATSEGRTGTARLTISEIPVASIRVTPGTSTVASGRTVQLSAQALDASDNVLNRTITWTSDQPAVATVAQSGLVTAINTGAARVSASVGAVSGSATVNVTPVPVASLAIAPNGATMTVGGTQQLTATAQDAVGAPLPGRQITWITGAPSVATVSQSGLVTAVGPGSAVVFAASEGVSASVTITVTTIGVATVRVTPPSGAIQQGQTLQLAFTALDAGNNVLPGKVAAWSSSNEAVATVSSTGRVVAITPGSVTISAVVDGVTGTGSYTVTLVPVGSVTVNPSSGTLAIGTSLTLTASLFDGSGNPLSPTGRVLGWASSAPAIATVNSSGVVQAVTAGSATITLTVEGRTATSVVTVSPVAVASVTLSPNTANLNAGATQAITATARDISNNVLTGRPVTWASSNTAVATINTGSTSGNNTVTAVAAGSTTISAVVGGVTGFATVAVTQVPIASITVTPSPGSVVEGNTLALTATARDALNNVLTGRTIVWSSSNPLVSVSQAGLVTATVNTASQVATITASSPGGGAGGSTPSGTSSVSVGFAIVATVSLSPSSANLSVGNTATLVATLSNAGGQALSPTGRTLTWLSLDPGFATVNASGVVTAVAPGSARIVAEGSSPSQSGTLPRDTAVVTVTNVPVASVTVTPKAGANPGSVHIGSTYSRSYVAIPRDAGGNALSGRSIVWSVSDLTKALITQEVDSTRVTGQAVTAVPIALTATSEGVAGSIAVTVDLVPITTVAVTPSSATLNLFSSPTQALAAAPLDSGGTAISGPALGSRSTVWSTGSAAIATVSALGLVTGIGAGSTTVSANIGGTVGGSAISVQAPVRSLVSAIAPDSLILPGSLSGLVTIRDSVAGPLAGRLITSSSSSSAIASVSPASGTSNASGQVSFTITGVAKGSAIITASSEGVSQLVTVRMLNPVANVAVTAPTDSVIGTATATVQATATLTDAIGGSITGRPTTWLSSATGVATVGASGLITVVGLGTTVVSATSEGRQGTLTFRVLPAVASIALAAPTDSILGAGPLTVTATVKDAANNPITGRVITWTSSDNLVATVNTSGVVTGVAPGNATITATVEGQTANVALRVIPGIASITLTPATDSLIGSGTIALTATALTSGGAPIPGRPLSITSATPGVAGVTPTPSGTTNASGQVPVTITQAGTGATLLTITAEGRTVTRTMRMLAAVATVTVTTPGDSVIGTGTLQATAVLRDASSNFLTGRPVTWNAPSNPAVASVSASGLITGLTPGTTTITATSEGQTSVAVTIRVLAAVNTVTLTAPDSSVYVTQTQQATAEVRDAANNVLTGRTVVWSTSNSAVATVSASGLITAIGAGSATISGTAEGKVGTLPFTVSLVPANTVTIAPSAPTLLFNASQTFTAVLRDTANNVLTGRTINWSSSSAKLTINPSSGSATAADTGAVTVTATTSPGTGVGNVATGTTAVTVNLVPIASVTLNPNTSTVAVGASQLVTVTVLDTNGAAFLPHGRACTITSANPAQATVSAATALTGAGGIFTFNVTGVASTGGGTVLVTVTCEGVNGTSAITVP